MTTIPAEPRIARYTAGLARTAAELREAQRLRHQVFAEEMGARLDTPLTGLDVDPLDAYCDHLLVRHGGTGEVVGTYRLLAPGRADRLYAESEFDLGALAALRPDLVEVGRTCVHAGHRNGAVVGLMWAGIARYMVEGGYGWLAGCCSVPVSQAAGVMDRVPLGPPEYRVAPLRPWREAGRGGAARGGAGRPATGTGSAAPGGAGEARGRAGEAPGGTRPGAARPAWAGLPPLLRGYLRLGAWVCGPPADDPDFGVADFFVLLPMAGMDPRYLRHFLGAAR
ncbi:GNAT family N-acetyltransferase [Planomonospora venezuelensis]|uniref:Putative hemolysin n=1 Tax=Planomonospora venezuelensis TaxID=1999 RepID=A0A841CWC7_PLAVE|nr:GNAT family N-acyltransferase [Planomonospora venezuelensis]MBB5961133.1 putative hemolysin [Planomonospora venezuelensis]GIM99803.1 hypothetical protein Pve01_14620 [Planomonospora venezuelensis]